jgi:SAM-dependent methyltransferase
MRNLIKNSVWLLRGGNNGLLFEQLARTNKKPEQVDGYVNGYDSPVVNEMKMLVSRKVADLIREGDSCLDLGCGTGRYIRELKSLVKARFHGLDLSKSTIENYTGKIEDVEALAGDFCDGSPFKAPFDVIYSVTMIQYIPFFKLDRFFRNINKALKTGGRVYIQFPPGDRGTPLHANYAYTRYKPEYLIRKMDKHNLDIVESGFVDPDRRSELGFFVVAEKSGEAPANSFFDYSGKRKTLTGQSRISEGTVPIQ